MPVLPLNDCTFAMKSLSSSSSLAGRSLAIGSLVLLGLLGASSLRADEPFPPLKSPGDGSSQGRNIQRTMRLLATSTPDHRNTVRVLFYGQSITEQGWWKIVADDLRARFPNANIIIENRALGGFSSQLLVKTAETDLYPFQPDLLIFHVYGAHDKYEDIIRRTRERTCAEILQQDDHVTKPEHLTEETDPAKLPIQKGNWDGFMNYNWLPSLSRKYETEWCDQRGLWKRYLTDYGLEPKALLKDGVHLNAHGEFLMAECVKSYLRRDAKFDPAPAESWVRTLTIGQDVQWQAAAGQSDRKILRVEFEGNRVDVICKTGVAVAGAQAVTVRIDGKKPSEFPELQGFTRALAKPGGKWPVIAPIGSEALRLVEDWTMEVQRDATDEKLFTFMLSGSKTGPDGEGRSDARFVSKSGRVVIAPEDWNVAYALSLSGIKPVPKKLTMRWSVVPYGVDEFISPGVKDAAVETTVTLAQGLVNARHTLEITGGDATAIAGIRIYRPPMGRME